MGKLFTEPVLIFCFLQFLLIFRLWTHRRLGEPRQQRRLAVLFLLAFLVIWIPSLPCTSTLLERGLDVYTDRTPATADPIDLIAVLGAGYVRDLNPNLDLVNDEERSRLVRAALWWREHPEVSIVVTGASAKDEAHSSSREAELSRDFLVAQGIPPNKIIVETTATNTREHPTAILKLPGITPATRIGVVTSCWHLRRATREFKRHFKTVVPFPYEFPPIEWSDWTGYLPSRIGVAYSTTLIHEYIGLVWYQIRHWIS